MRRAGSRSSSRRPSAWGWMVTVSGCLIGGLAALMGIWWLASNDRRSTGYEVRGTLDAVTLDLGSADAEVVGGGDRPVVAVRHVDEFAFGRRAASSRELAGGVLRLRSRCPKTILGTCSASYRVIVPDNVAVTLRTSSGNVRFTRFRGSATIDTRTGDIAVGEYCGFSLRARADTGDVRAAAACAPERLELRSRTGDVKAIVPPGRYNIDAASDGGSRTVRGLSPTADAPFVVQALSSSGDVEVEAARP